MERESIHQEVTKGCLGGAARGDGFGVVHSICFMPCMQSHSLYVSVSNSEHCYKYFHTFPFLIKNLRLSLPANASSILINFDATIDGFLIKSLSIKYL